MPTPPRVDPGPGWRLVDERENRPFDARLLSVVPVTAVYEDADRTPTARRRSMNSSAMGRGAFSSPVGSRSRRPRPPRAR